LFVAFTPLPEESKAVAPPVSSIFHHASSPFATPIAGFTTTVKFAFVVPPLLAVKTSPYTPLELNETDVFSAFEFANVAAPGPLSRAQLNVKGFPGTVLLTTADNSNV